MVLPVPVSFPPPDITLNSLNPCPIVEDHPLALMVRGLTSHEEEYFHTFPVAPQMPQKPSPPDQHYSDDPYQAPLKTPSDRMLTHPQLLYIPPWLPAQQGPFPVIPLIYQVPLTPIPVHPAPVTPPLVPPPVFSQAPMPAPPAPVMPPLAPPLALAKPIPQVDGH